MKKTVGLIIISLVLLLAVSCASTTRVDALEFNLAEKEIALNSDLEKKEATINTLLADLDAAAKRIEELQNSAIPSVEAAIDSLEAVVPVGEKRIKNLESVVPVGEQRIETLEAYLPLYYEVTRFIEKVLPVQQRAIDANQELIDALTSLGFSAEY